MGATAGFTAFFALTLVLLGLVVATGLRAKRRWHVTFVAAAVASLGVTIVFAVALGKHYDLEAAGPITPIHLTIAKLAAASYVLPIVTGLRTIFVPSTRRLHRKVAFLALALTVAAAITGTWMMCLAPRVS
ncbi:MAG: hypothetical protein ACKVXR_14815 [Planctomycetota bacterium]